MNPSAWIALGSLSLVIIVQTATVAFAMGGLFSRVRAVEARPTDSDCKQELAILSTKFEALEATLKDVSHDLKNLLTGKITPMRRMRDGE